MLILLCLSITLSPHTTMADSPITIVATENAITINGLSPLQLQKLSQLTEFELRSIISVYISDDYYPESSIALAILGKAEISSNGLQFKPYTPFKIGQQYLITFSLLSIEEILVHEEFFTLKRHESNPEIPKPLRIMFDAIKFNHQKRMSYDQPISIRPLTNVITISGLSSSQIMSISKLSNLDQNQVITVYEINNMDKSTDGNVSDYQKIPGFIVLAKEDIKFIPDNFLNTQKKYLITISLKPIGEILIHEEFFTLLTTEKLFLEKLINEL